MNYRLEHKSFKSSYYNKKDEAEALETRIVYEFEDGGLDSVIENFECFLRGCGFSFSGSLEIVEPNEDLPSLDEEE
jgi:hypothetical protein